MADLVVLLDADQRRQDQVRSPVTIALKVEGGVGLLARELIAGLVRPVGHGQNVARLLSAGHRRIQEVDDVAHAPIADGAFQAQGRGEIQYGIARIAESDVVGQAAALDILDAALQICADCTASALDILDAAAMDRREL